MATSEPSDQELLQCPEAVEPQFIQRGRADLIATQAGKMLQEKRPKHVRKINFNIDRSM